MTDLLGRAGGGIIGTVTHMDQGALFIGSASDTTDVCWAERPSGLAPAVCVTSPARGLEGRFTMAVKFYEKQTDYGIQFNWVTDTPLEWRRTLKIVKDVIPFEWRTYIPEEKEWAVREAGFEAYAEAKRIATNEEQASELDAEVIEEFTLEKINPDLTHLNSIMRERAEFATRAVIGLIDTEVEYSVAEDDFGAWDEESGRWLYMSGSYSGYSPEEKDQRKRDQAIRRIDRLMKNYVPDWHNRFQTGHYLLRLQLLHKFDYRCYVCGIHITDLESPQRMHIHRVIPGKNGGEYVENNCMVLCASCHKRHEGKSWEEITAVRGHDA